MSDERQTALPVAGKTKTQVERELANRLTRSIPNQGRALLELEADAAPETPGVRAIRKQKQRGLF